MARQCKCVVTGEIGTTDLFYKFHDGSRNRYFKNEEIYNEWFSKKEERRLLLTYISENIFEGEVIPSVFLKKLKEVNVDNQTLLEALQLSLDGIKYARDNVSFSNAYQMSAYFVAIIKNNIYEAAQIVKIEREVKKPDNNADIDLFESAMKAKSTKASNDISMFLEDD